VEMISKYYKSHTRRATYFIKFFCCEWLNFFNVIGQIYFTNRFLGYQFTTYGLDVLGQSEENLNTRDDAMNRVFPKIAKCTFHKYGPTGTIQNHDGLCVLPLNIINEKIYCFLWFWLIFLAAVTGVWLLYRLATILFHDLRVSTIYHRAEGVVDKQKISATLSNPKHSFLQRLGDYLLLYLITKNLSPFIMKDIFDAIAPQHYSVPPAIDGTDQEKEPLKQKAYA